jgi:hypothetical protein
MLRPEAAVFAHPASPWPVAMLFVASGYGVFPNDLPGNVLLAFSPR